MPRMSRAKNYSQFLKEVQSPSQRSKNKLHIYMSAFDVSGHKARKKIKANHTSSIISYSCHHRCKEARPCRQFVNKWLILYTFGECSLPTFMDILCFLLVLKPRISPADSRRKSLFWPHYWTREPWRSRWMGPSSRSASSCARFPCEAPRWFSCPRGSPRNLSHRTHSWLAPRLW